MKVNPQMKVQVVAHIGYVLSLLIIENVRIGYVKNKCSHINGMPYIYIIFVKMKNNNGAWRKIYNPVRQSDGWWLFAAHPLNCRCVSECVCYHGPPAVWSHSLKVACTLIFPENPPSSLSPSPFILTSLWPVYHLMWILSGWAEMLRLMMMPSLQYIWSSVRAFWTPRATSLAPQASSQYGG